MFVVERKWDSINSFTPTCHPSQSEKLLMYCSMFNISSFSILTQFITKKIKLLQKGFMKFRLYFCWIKIRCQSTSNGDQRLLSKIHWCGCSPLQFPHNHFQFFRWIWRKKNTKFRRKPTLVFDWFGTPLFLSRITQKSMLICNAFTQIK